MASKLTLALGSVVVLAVVWFAARGAVPGPNAVAVGPTYSRDGVLTFPENYRNWVYLSSGFDMSYTADANPGHHMFDNVFVNPEAYRRFVATGTWPDKTQLVLESRGAEGRGSINQKGNYQSADVMGVEVHVKDAARFPGKWAFFAFNSSRVGKLLPTSTNCYSCHSQHGAVDTTFVQFYPTLMPIAQSKGTVASSYQNESKTPASK